jgi:hypothetical protein
VSFGALSLDFVRFVLPFIGACAFEGQILRSVRLGVASSASVHCLRRKLPIIGGSSFEFGMVGGIPYGCDGLLGLYFGGHIVLLILAFSFEFATRGSVGRGSMDGWVLLDGIRFVCCFIGGFDDLRVVSVLDGSVGNRHVWLLAQFVRLVIFVIAGVGIEGSLGFGAGVLSFVRGAVPQVQISQTHWWPWLRLDSGFRGPLRLGVCINKIK